MRRLGHRSAALALEYGARLSRRISVALLLTLAALWVTGVLWLVLHYLLARPDEFGIVRHPLEAPTVLVHGIVALLALFLLGWFAGRHVGAAGSGRRAGSGWLLTALMGVLVVAGCSLLFVTDAAWQSAIGLVHETLGVALLLPVLAHGVRASAASRAPRHGARRAPQPDAAHADPHQPRRRHNARS